MIDFNLRYVLQIVLNQKTFIIINSERVIAVAERYGMDASEVLDNIGELFFSFIFMKIINSCRPCLQLGSPDGIVEPGKPIDV